MDSCSMKLIANKVQGRSKYSDKGRVVQKTQQGADKTHVPYPHKEKTVKTFAMCAASRKMLQHLQSQKHHK